MEGIIFEWFNYGTMWGTMVGFLAGMIITFAGIVWYKLFDDFFKKQRLKEEKIEKDRVDLELFRLKNKR